MLQKIKALKCEECDAVADNDNNSNNNNIRSVSVKTE
jgi:hypothetical protein